MDKVTLNNKEQKRLLVLNEVLAGRVTGKEAAEVLGVSLRHIRRLAAGYRRGGAAALAQDDNYLLTGPDTGAVIFRQPDALPLKPGKVLGCRPVDHVLIDSP